MSVSVYRNLSCNIRIENFPHFAWILCLAERPHQFGHCRLRRHIAARDYSALQQAASHVIDRKVAGLIQALAAGYNADAGLCELFQLLKQISSEKMESAGSEGLEYDPFVTQFLQSIKNGRFCVGDQFQQKDIR